MIYRPRAGFCVTFFLIHSFGHIPHLVANVDNSVKSFMRKRVDFLRICAAKKPHLHNQYIPAGKALPVGQTSLILFFGMHILQIIVKSSLINSISGKYVNMSSIFVHFKRTEPSYWSQADAVASRGCKCLNGSVYFTEYSVI
jgi:hypothetical protein